MSHTAPAGARCGGGTGVGALDEVGVKFHLEIEGWAPVDVHRESPASHRR